MAIMYVHICTNTFDIGVHIVVVESLFVCWLTISTVPSAAVYQQYLHQSSSMQKDPRQPKKTKNPQYGQDR